MGYIVSYNKPNNSCKVHLDNCCSIKQVIGDKPTNNQIYSEVFNTCDEVQQYIEKQGYKNYKDCNHCKPNCC